MAPVFLYVNFVVIRMNRLMLCDVSSWIWNILGFSSRMNKIKRNSIQWIVLVRSMSKYVICISSRIISWFQSKNFLSEERTSILWQYQKQYLIFEMRRQIISSIYLSLANSIRSNLITFSKRHSSEKRWSMPSWILMILRIDSNIMISSYFRFLHKKAIYSFEIVLRSKVPSRISFVLWRCSPMYKNL